MKKTNLFGVYEAPMLAEVAIACEQGFAVSVDGETTLDGLTSIDGVWDE